MMLMAAGSKGRAEHRQAGPAVRQDSCLHPQAAAAAAAARAQWMYSTPQQPGGDERDVITMHTSIPFPRIPRNLPCALLAFRQLPLQYLCARS